jgi:hypothetical protein
MTLGIGDLLPSFEAAQQASFVTSQNLGPDLFKGSQPSLIELPTLDCAQWTEG